MTNYTYLGWGTTDSNGVAHLDHDANGDPVNHSYTGVGAGELDIVASLDDPNSISDSSLQSETYSIFDCIVIDTCLDATKYTGWNNLNNRLQVSYDEDGRLLSNSSGSIGAYTLSAPDTSQTGLYDYDWQYPYCIEFDVTALSNFTIQIKDANEHQGEMPFSNVNDTHIKFNVTATSLTATVGETSKNPVTVNFDDLTTIVFIVSNGNSMKFKDLRVYPI